MSILNSDQLERVRRHVSNRKAEGVAIKSAIMEFAAIERSLPVQRPSRRTILVQIGSTQLGFVDANGPSCTPFGKATCDDKSTAREFLAADDLPVPDSRTFGIDDEKIAWSYASDLQGPVVVKPLSLSRGRGITTSVTSYDELVAAFDLVRAQRPRTRHQKVLVERQIRGNDYRIFVVDGDIVAATKRRRARVRGDGSHSIQELIRRKNRRRRRNPYLGEHLIPTNITLLDSLRAQGLSLDHIPAHGELITLRNASNLSSGGDSVDVTDRIHPSYKEMAVNAVNAIPGMKYAGVDLITEDIQADARCSNVAITEVEYSPAPITYFPWLGAARDMYGPTLDHYLRQERKNSRILGTIKRRWR